MSVTQKRRVIFSLVGMVALAGVLMGAGSAGTSAFRRAPDHVHIVVMRIQPPATGRTIVFDQQVGDVARTIYAQLVSGLHVPENAVVHCPTTGRWDAPYYHYELTFSHMGIETAVATSDAFGCRGLTLIYPAGGHDYYSWLAPDGTSFWETLHQLVNAPAPI